jgi:hypothetical protein
LERGADNVREEGGFWVVAAKCRCGFSTDLLVLSPSLENVHVA